MTLTRLRFERLRRGMNQTRLGLATGIPQATISRIETGRERPTQHQLATLAAFFLVKEDELLREVQL